MKTPLQQPTQSTDTNLCETGGDPYFLCTTPIIEPLFSGGSGQYLSKEIALPVERLKAFLAAPSACTIKISDAIEASYTLRELLEKPENGPKGCSRARLHHLWATEDLVQLSGALSSLVDQEALVLARRSGSLPSNLNDSILAGLADLDQSLASQRRRTSARAGGLCERLAHKFEDLITYVRDVQASVGPITCRRFDRTPYVKDISKRLQPVINQARELMSLVPEDRWVRTGFEHRALHAVERLNDFHLPEVVRALEVLVADMWEVKSVFQTVEGLRGKNVDRVAVARSRRHVPNKSERA